MIKRMMVAIVLAALAAVVVSQAMAPAAVGQETCSGSFPYWTRVAETEAQNNDRIDCVRQKKADNQAQQRRLDARIAHLHQRLETARATRHDARLASVDIAKLLDSLLYIRGEINWLYTTNDCESGGDYQAHSDSGTYHGGYQDSYESWGDRYGYHDPHDAPSWRQDQGNDEIAHERGTGPWPKCGQLVPFGI